MGEPSKKGLPYYGLKFIGLCGFPCGKNCCINDVEYPSLNNPFTEFLNYWLKRIAKSVSL